MSSIWTLRRNTADGKVAGVCSGLARHADVDPVLVRVGAVLLALSGGIGLVAYVAIWLFVPDEHGRAPIDQHLPAARRWPRPLLVGLLIAACFAVAGLLSPILPFGFGSALVLAAIWYFGYYKNRPRSSDQPSSVSSLSSSPGLSPQPPESFATFSGPATPFTEAAAAWQRRIADVQRQQAPAAAFETPPAPPTPAWPRQQATPTPAALADPVTPDQLTYLATPDPVGLYADPPAPTTIAPHRRPSARRLRLVALAVLGLTLAGLGVADASGVPVGITTYLAAALLVGGLTLVAAGWFGRARGILPVTVLVTLATVGGTVASAAHLQDWGVKDVAYATQSAVPVTDAVSGGQLKVDLSGLTVTRDQAYTASVGYGQLELVRPSANDVRILWSVGEGVATTPDGGTLSGQNLSGTIEPTAVEPGDPVLTVTVHVDHGRLEVG